MSKLKSLLLITGLLFTLPVFCLQLPIKGYQQTEDYTCGPSSVMSLMRYYGMLTDAQMNKTTEMRIAHEMGSSPDTGTTPQQVAAWLSGHGFNVISGTDGTLAMLKGNLAHHIPTLVEWIDWGGHWDAVAGYDKQRLILADPAAHFTGSKNGLTKFDSSRFDSMWFDAQYFKPGKLVKGVYIVAVPKGEQ